MVVPAMIDGLPVTAIGNRAFRDKDAITTVTLPAGLVTVGDSAFEHCDLLANVTLPAGVVSLGLHAFRLCPVLTTLTIPASTTTIGLNAFDLSEGLLRIDVDSANPSFSSIDGVLFDKSGETLIAYPEGRTGSYVVPDGVKVISAFSFSRSLGLTAVVLPDSLISIGGYAFSSCWNLAATVEIPESVMTIDSYAFISCGSLMAINVAPDNAAYKSDEGVLFNKSGGRLMAYPAGKVGPYSVPDGVNSIDSSAFMSSHGLSSLVLPDSVTSIGAAAFKYCYELVSVVIPSGVQVIETETFFYCSNLVNVELPQGLTRIRYAAFQGCISLSAVDFPKNLEVIEEYAFAECVGLSSVRIPDSVTTIKSGAFRYCFGLKHVRIGTGTTSIEFWAFADCRDLEGVYFEGDAPVTGIDVFVGSENVTAFHLPGALGWSGVFAGRPAVLWDPEIAVASAVVDEVLGEFRFDVVAGAAFQVAVERGEEISGTEWSRVGRVELTNGSAKFIDVDHTISGNRFYRLRMP